MVGIEGGTAGARNVEERHLARQETTDGRLVGGVEDRATGAAAPRYLMAQLQSGERLPVLSPKSQDFRQPIATESQMPLALLVLGSQPRQSVPEVGQSGRQILTCRSPNELGDGREAFAE